MSKSRNLTSMTALVAIILISLLTGCRSDRSADANDLLRTIPSDAQCVAVANLNSILDKAGCKVKDAEITPSAEVTQAVRNINDSNARRLANLFLSGKSGVEPSVSVLFVEGSVAYNCGFLADPDLFKESVEKEWKVKFVETDGINICNNIAYKGNIYWARTDSRRIDVDEVKRFSNLSERQSILSLDGLDRLAEIEDDVAGWGNIQGILNASNMEFKQRSMITMVLSSLFDDPQDIAFSLDFKKGQVNAEATILNAKGKTARLNIPSSRIDVKTIKDLQASAGVVIAASLPAKLIKTLDKEISDRGASMMAIVMKSLSQVDGTTAVALSQNGQAMQGVITTTGNNLTDLSNLLASTGATVKRDGKLVRFSQGTLSGPLTVSENAELFKGAMFGVLMANDGNVPISGKTLLLLTPDDGGLKLELKAITDTPKENAFLSILKKAGTKGAKAGTIK